MPKRLTVLTPSDITESDSTDLNPPLVITGSCVRCGKCCKIWGCPLVDPTTNLCPIWEFRPYPCRRFPVRDEDIKAVVCPGYIQTGL
ncbi:hypothetical protein LCGC14_0974930 [marine sediment metagenome]|uniref:Uncharacterized protein n=1 Tax=marine sediment metagenome TaxID=412755 RepID=A0A0F9NWR0_9ZZZZ